jgi:hypothetical protein
MVSHHFLVLHLTLQAPRFPQLAQALLVGRRPRGAVQASLVAGLRRTRPDPLGLLGSAARQAQLKPHLNAIAVHATATMTAHIRALL